MGDGLRRASDYANSAIAPFLRDVKRRGNWEVTERYLITANSGTGKMNRADLLQWVGEFAQRHELKYEHNKETEVFTFTALRPAFSTESAPSPSDEHAP